MNLVPPTGGLEILLFQLSTLPGNIQIKKVSTKSFSEPFINNQNRPDSNSKGSENIKVDKKQEELINTTNTIKNNISQNAMKNLFLERGRKVVV